MTFVRSCIIWSLQLLFSLIFFRPTHVFNVKGASRALRDRTLKGPLSHPTEQNGERFLPWCYGYATAIRRAQGADLFHGAIYFEQKKFPAARGYAYVACSRFKSRQGVCLYGKLRRSDFLPMGATKDAEQLERGYQSDSLGVLTI